MSLFIVGILCVEIAIIFEELIAMTEPDHSDLTKPHPFKAPDSPSLAPWRCAWLDCLADERDPIHIITRLEVQQPNQSTDATWIQQPDNSTDAAEPYQGTMLLPGLEMSE